MFFSVRVLIFAVLLLLGLAPADFRSTVYAAPGDLDPAFNATGRVLTPVNKDARAGSVAVQADGKIIAAGYSSDAYQSYFTVTRYNTNGNLDTAFNPAGGVPGTVTTAVGSTMDMITSLALQSDGKIVAAGYSYSGTQIFFALARYNANGSLDTTFNPTGAQPGTLTTAIGTISQVSGVAVQPDGKIVAAGYSYNGAQNLFALARYNTNGTLDSTFNPAGGLPGTVTTAVGALDDRANAVAVHPSNGTIIATGYSNDGTRKLFALVRYNANGSLDTTFNTTGKTTTAIGSSDDVANSAVLQASDSRIVTGGYSNSGGLALFALARYNTDGSLDTSFNSTGKTTTNVGSATDRIYSVALQPADGKIVAAGGSDSSAGVFALTRYNTDGSLDMTFSSGAGIVTTALGDSDDEVRAVAIQPSDSKIIAAGTSFDSWNAQYAFALARYNTNGSLDTSFNSTGKVTTVIGNKYYDQAYAVAVQPSDNKIVAAGLSYIDTKNFFALARYNTDGTPDTTFNTTGIVTTAIGTGNDEAHAVAIQPADGRIVAAGVANNGTKNVFALVRYNSNGSLDTSFGTGGIVTTAVGLSAAGAYSLAIQPNGKIIAAGDSYLGTGYDVFTLVRYNTDGSLDTTFGTGGIVTTAIGTGHASASAVALQPEGKIVAGGAASAGVKSLFALARYNTNGSLDASFGSGGTLTTAIGTTEPVVNALAVQPSGGKIVAAGTAANASSQTLSFALARYNPNGSLDTSFNSSGTLITAIGGGGEANAVAIQTDGKIVAAGYSNNGTQNLFTVARYLGDSLSFTVTYDGNGSTGGAAPVDNNPYAPGDTVPVQNNTGSLVRFGYTFAGWNTQANGNGTPYAGGDSFTMPSANATLYAQWTSSGVMLVRIAETAADYTDLQSAYDKALSGQTILSQALLCGQNLLFDLPVSIKLRGGYNAAYSSKTGSTLVSGSMEISGNSIDVSDIVIQ